MRQRDTRNTTKELAISTTLNVVLGVCTIKIAQTIAADIQETFSFILDHTCLGAILHGQPMPWDDDFDSAFRFAARYKFMEACQKSKLGLHCDGLFGLH
jgi:LicD family